MTALILIGPVPAAWTEVNGFVNLGHMSILAAPLLLFSLLSGQNQPASIFPLGKETTYVTSPLDKEGYIDYAAALNDLLGKGITPEKNANVLLWKAFGPNPPFGEQMPDEFFKRLGIPELPKDGNYFMGLDAYMMVKLKVATADMDRIRDQLDYVTQRPWTAKEYPHFASWLKDNDKALALAMEASQRSEYFNPLVSNRTDGEPASLIATPLPWHCRQLVSALLARAMLRVDEEKLDDAWQDLLACHRLGRLVGRGATMMEGLIGIAIGRVTDEASLVYLERAKPTSKKVQECLRDLQALPPVSPLADKIELAERFVYLDSVQLIRRRGPDALSGKAKKPHPQDLQALAEIDWEPALRVGNRWFDRQVAALRLQKRADREKACGQIDEEVKMLKVDMRPENLAKFSTEPAKFLGLLRPDKLVAKRIGEIFISLINPSQRKVQQAYDRMEQSERNLRVAFALAAYHADQGRYPARLDELAPKYLATVPDDLFSGKALVYRPSAKGYLFYSVGVNGKDEDGRSMDDGPTAGDDLPVHMPLPELKRLN